MIGTKFIKRFSLKLFVSANGPILGAKMTHPLNSGFIVKIFQNFAQ